MLDLQAAFICYDELEAMGRLSCIEMPIDLLNVALKMHAPELTSLTILKHAADQITNIRPSRVRKRICNKQGRVKVHSNKEELVLQKLANSCRS